MARLDMPSAISPRISRSDSLIAFSRPDPATGEPRVFIANPDGRHEHQLLLPLPGDGPVWAPDGGKLLVSVFRPDASARPATVNADGSGFTVLDVPQLPPDIDVGCRAWSPDATRLLCGAIRFGGDPSLNGIYTIRASDGGGLRRLTVNPYPPRDDFGGGDLPGDFSPDGSQFVFMRAKPGAGPVPDRDQTGALFVENTDGTGLRQLTPYGLANSHDNGVAHWSADRSRILFASAHGSLRRRNNSPRPKPRPRQAATVDSRTSAGCCPSTCLGGPSSLRLSRPRSEVAGTCRRRSPSRADAPLSASLSLVDGHQRYCHSRDHMRRPWKSSWPTTGRGGRLAPSHCTPSS